tara:strand:+ start:2745 stop:3818 length:1074 start_codon:yes stop_codon:yes gene_type:complete
MKYNLSTFYRNKKVLVTGATGFKGAWLCNWLKILGAKVYGVGYNPNKNKNLFYKLNLQKKINLKILDVRDYKKIKNIIDKIKPSLIFHLAAQPLIYESYKKPYLTFDVNFRGSLNIVDSSFFNKSVKSVIIVTSDKCYESNNSSKGFKEGDLLGGIDPYSASKSSTEIMVRAYSKSFLDKRKNFGISTGRAGNVIGGGDWSTKRLIPDSVRSIKSNKTIILRNPNFNRPWQHVLEPLKGYLILAKEQYLKPKKFSGAWNFGTNPKSLTTVKSIVNYIIEFWGKGKLISKKNNFYEQANLQLNINKAKKFLKWKPTYNIKNSVKLTVDWYFKVLQEKKSPIIVTENQIKKYMNDSKIS